jgi:hypothetical protein
MGYACPVCETPQRDGEHLAHHLAFTAMLHGGDHETWLDDRVPDWSDRVPAGLAAEVTPHAEDAEYHEVFEDTVDRGRPDVNLGAHDHAGHNHTGHDHGSGGDRAAPERPSAAGPAGETDPEVAAAIREAREMAREVGDDGTNGESDAGDRETGSAASDDPEDPSA